MAEPPARRPLPDRLRAVTTARVAIGRIGTAVPTAATLSFQLAHARARDAVHAALDMQAFGEGIGGHPFIDVHSEAADRATYLMRPDLGRRLNAEGFARLCDQQSQLAIVVADGLSAAAIRAHAVPLIQAILDRATQWRIGPIILVGQGRVAIGDDIGAVLGADLVIVLIGERPGLTAADSLSAYLTWKPRTGRLDSDRSCVSNIRPPHGWSIAGAADEIMRIAHDARQLGCTGVAMAVAAQLGQKAVPTDKSSSLASPADPYPER